MFGWWCVEGVRADKKQPHDQGREMADDDRNVKPRANVSLKSNHTGLRLRDNPGLEIAPRTFLFAGKAAPPIIWRS
jgi:hypothetical protein